MNVGFIGAGNMGTAIIKGIISGNLSENINIFAFDKDSEKTENLQKLGVSIAKSNQELVESCKYVFLAVKPQVFDIVLDEISSHISDENVLISIAAGISAKYIKSRTKPDAKVILAMPNTPLLLGEGAVAAAKTDGISDEEFEFVMKIFGASGIAEVLPEDKMKEIISINGSSPAFIYLFAKAFIDYAEKSGISVDTAKSLFSQTLIGSAKMITESGYSIDELIKMVSSPGGTTLAGLEKLYDGKFSEIVNEACESCTKRAYELSK